MSLRPATSTESSVKIPEGTISISYTLDIQEIIRSVQDDTAGATAVFIGTTRNSFQGKTVARLEYQAYTKLALKTITDIVRDTVSSITRSEHASPYVASLVRCAVHHRIGIVPVGEPSIVIAVSSPHRKESFLACEKILEDVKRKAQIWKQEFYEGEDESTAQWKENH
ncbi:hypothetical protein Ac2012v2_000738 [Leucoagaricus gongylophorus]